MNESTDSGLDWRAIGQAVVSGVLILVPLAVANAWWQSSTTDGRSDTLVGLIFTLLILVVGAIVGFTAAVSAGRREQVHGAVASAAAYGVVQLGGIVRRVIAGEPISNPLGYIYLALLMATVGLLGASLAQRTRYVRN